MSALFIDNLYKTYPPHTEALRGISLTIEEGDFFALLGPNGAGKSTTIGIISSLINKSSGTVKIFGHDIDKNWGDAKACMGIVPQEMNFNIFEKVKNIVEYQAGYYGMPHAEAVIATEKALKEVGLWEKRNVAARALSGGMKRRLMIARAIVHRPRMLILDEPTAGVDIETRRSMWDFLEKINKEGTTIILITHYLEEAEKLCRNIAIINHGRIVENTSMRNFLGNLKTQSFILELSAPLKEVPVVPGFKLMLNDSMTLEIEVPESLTLNEMFAALNTAHIQVSGLRNKTNRVEELFMRITGSAENV